MRLMRQLKVTTMADWQVGCRINLERALALGDELGGHIVSGHVDGKAVVTKIVPEGDSYLMAFDVPDHWPHLLPQRDQLPLMVFHLLLIGSKERCLKLW